MLVEQERRADRNRSFSPGKKLLARDVEGGVEMVVPGVMLELRARRKIPGGIREHDGLGARILSERHEDETARFIDGELAPIKPDSGVLHRLMRFVENGEHVARGTDLLEQAPLPFANQ